MRGGGVACEGLEDVASLFSRRGDNGAERGEVLSGVEGSESAGDFHLHLHHAQRLFRQVLKGYGARDAALPAGFHRLRRSWMGHWDRGVRSTKRRQAVLSIAASSSCHSAAPTTCPVALRARIRRCRASPPAPEEEMESHGDHRHGIHRSFAQAAFLQDGQVKREQRVDLVHDRLIRFGKSLSVEDEVVIEATGNSAAVERILRPFVKRVVVANPRMVRAIAYARVKTDKIDAVISARLHAGGFLPEVWVATTTPNASGGRR